MHMYTSVESERGRWTCSRCTLQPDSCLLASLPLYLITQTHVNFFYMFPLYAVCQLLPTIIVPRFLKGGRQGARGTVAFLRFGAGVTVLGPFARISMWTQRSAIALQALLPFTWPFAQYSSGSQSMRLIYEVSRNGLAGTWIRRPQLQTREARV